MATALPPLPRDTSDTTGMPTAASQSGAPSAFAGGLPALMAPVQQIEEGIKQLAGMLPSAAPMLAQMLAALRQMIPSAIASDAGQGQGQPQAGGPPPMAPPPQQ